MEFIDFNQPQKTIEVYYVTDPICSHCWALEPVLRRFIEQYGDYFNFHTVMGGLLEKWGGGLLTLQMEYQDPQMLQATGEKLESSHACLLMGQS